MTPHEELKQLIDKAINGPMLMVSYENFVPLADRCERAERRLSRAVEVIKAIGFIDPECMLCGWKNGHDAGCKLAAVLDENAEAKLRETE